MVSKIPSVILYIDLFDNICETETRLLQWPVSGPAGNHLHPQAAEGDAADMRNQSAVGIASSENEAEAEEPEDNAESLQPQPFGKKRQRRPKY